MSSVLFDESSDALTADADLIYTERAKSLNIYYQNNVYLFGLYQQDLADYFNDLKKQWLSDVNLISSSYLTTQHPSYLKILSLGDQVIPLLLEDLRQNGTHWFMALTALTGENPIKEANTGRVDNMIADWISWGQRNNFI